MGATCVLDLLCAAAPLRRSSWYVHNNMYVYICVLYIYCCRYAYIIIYLHTYIYHHIILTYTQYIHQLLHNTHQRRLAETSWKMGWTWLRLESSCASVPSSEPLPVRWRPEIWEHDFIKETVTSCGTCPRFKDSNEWGLDAKCQVTCSSLIMFIYVYVSYVDCIDYHKQYIHENEQKNNTSTLSASDAGSGRRCQRMSPEEINVARWGKVLVNWIKLLH